MERTFEIFSLWSVRAEKTLQEYFRKSPCRQRKRFENIFVMVRAGREKFLINFCVPRGPPPRGGAELGHPRHTKIGKNRDGPGSILGRTSPRPNSAPVTVLADRFVLVVCNRCGLYCFCYDCLGIHCGTCSLRSGEHRGVPMARGTLVLPNLELLEMLLQQLLELLLLLLLSWLPRAW